MLLLMVISGSGCSAFAVAAQPAVLVESSVVQQAEVQRVLATALAAPAVSIATDAFTRSSMLVIDAQTARRGGQRLQGQVMSRPDRFQLLQVGARCVLLHERTGERHELQGVRCKPAVTQPASGQ